MPSKSSCILNAINRSPKSGLNILTAATHERSQSLLEEMPHTFWLLNHKSFKKWDYRFAPLPKNYVSLESGSIPRDVTFDLVLAQNRYSQYQVFHRISEDLNIPMVTIEHTLPQKEWGSARMDQFKKMKGDLDVFITRFQKDQWGWPDDTPLISCAADTDFFCPNDSVEKDGKIMTVVNQYDQRTYFTGFDVYKKATEGFETKPIGDTPGLSDAAKGPEHLKEEYQKAGVFLNTSRWSTMPVTLIEAMACGCPIVSTATCSIPDWLTDGYDAFVSNDIEYLREKLGWCLNNADKAREMGKNARQTAVEKLSVGAHREKWQSVFDQAFGKAKYIQHV